MSSAKQLVRGEPNVSYICSRYYRAPELIFGATDYTSSIGMCVFIFKSFMFYVIRMVDYTIATILKYNNNKTA